MVDRARGEAVAHGQAGVARADDDGGVRMTALGFAAEAYFTSTVTLVGLVMMSYTAERFCDWATMRPDLVGRRVGVDVVGHLDAVEAVAHVAVDAEDALDVHPALDASP